VEVQLFHPADPYNFIKNMTFQRYYQPEVQAVTQFANGYPVPTTLTYFWNYGVYALISLVAQLVTGMLIIAYYAADLNISFMAIENYMRDVTLAFDTRYFHANGASFFFFVVFIHLFRGIFYTSYLPPRVEVWIIGSVLFVLLMAAAFLGYVLPWGQMSYWAATVIIQLFTAIPLIGKEIVEWVWGGFTLGNTAIRRLFSLHFIVPFIIALLSLFHIYVLHRFGSNEPVGVDTKAIDRTNMNPYYIIKDLFGISILVTIFIYFVGIIPNALGHWDNYVVADPVVTPPHIVPEWYFLWAYAILRSIPHKLLGVVGFASSIIYIWIIAWIIVPTFGRNFTSRYLRILYYLFICGLLVLGTLGASAPTPPVLYEGRLHALIYFTILIFSNIYITTNQTISKMSISHENYGHVTKSFALRFWNNIINNIPSILTFLWDNPLFLYK
jgi:quinol-cytochrome oxidoreductase complex cytochrome b subunit